MECKRVGEEKWGEDGPGWREEGWRRDIERERGGKRTEIITSSRRRDKIRKMWIGKRREEEEDDKMEFEWMGEETKWGEDAAGWREDGWGRDI